MSPDIGYVLFLYFGLPVLLALVLRPSWKALLSAYGLWFGLLGLWGLSIYGSSGTSAGEAIGWPMIMGLFFTAVAIPVLVLGLKIVGVR